MTWTDIDFEKDQYCIRQIGYDDLLKGEGWSDPDKPDMYSNSGDDYFDNDDDFDEWLEDSMDFAFDDQCHCDVDKIFVAAEDLIHLLTDSPQLFPRNHAQVEGFALPGRKTYGSWSRWIDYSRSQPKEFRNVGIISLTGCPKPGHSCRILMNDDRELVIDGDRGHEITEIFENVDTADGLVSEFIGKDEPDQKLNLLVQIAEELWYDERNYGLLHIEDLNAKIFKIDDSDLNSMIY